MAGWTCPDNELIEWDGTIKAKTYRGDGSQLTGITTTGGGGSLWTSGANFIYPIIGTQVISGAGLIVPTGDISGAYIYGDGSNLRNLPILDYSSAALVSNITALSGAFVHASGALYTSAAQTAAATYYLSGAYYANVPQTSSALIHLSGAFWAGNYPSSAALVTNINALSGAFVHASGALYASAARIFAYENALSGAFYVASSALWASAANIAATAYSTSIAFVHASGALYSLSGAHATTRLWLNTASSALWASAAAITSVSGAYYAHAADISDPHGATLSQTSLSGGTIVTTGVISGAVIQVMNDWSTMSAAYVANVVYGTGATGPTASGFPIGTLYIKYTP